MHVYITSYILMGLVMAREDLAKVNTIVEGVDTAVRGVAVRGVDAYIRWCFAYVSRAFRAILAAPSFQTTINQI